MKQNKCVDSTSWLYSQRMEPISVWFSGTEYPLILFFISWSCFKWHFSSPFFFTPVLLGFQILFPISVPLSLLRKGNSHPSWQSSFLYVVYVPYDDSWCDTRLQGECKHSKWEVENPWNWVRSTARIMSQSTSDISMQHFYIHRTQTSIPDTIIVSTSFGSWNSCCSSGRLGNRN